MLTTDQLRTPYTKWAFGMAILSILLYILAYFRFTFLLDPGHFLAFVPLEVVLLVPVAVVAGLVMVGISMRRGEPGSVMRQIAVIVLAVVGLLVVSALVG